MAVAEGACPEPHAWPRWLLPLRRRTTGGNFSPEIDGIRCIAIGMVLLFHLSVYAREATGRTIWGAAAFDAGHLGVHLFFVLSGYVLGLPFARAARGLQPSVRLDRYFLRRLTRLEPPYVLALLGSFAALVAIRGASIDDQWPHLLASIGYVHGLVYGASSTIIGVAWSLEVEVQFYLLAPLLALVFRLPRTGRLSVFAAVAGLAALAQLLWIAPNSRASFFLPAYAQYFVAGFMLADAHAEGTPAGGSRAWDLAWLGVWPLLLVVDGSPVAPLLLAPLLAVLVAAALHGRMVRALVSQPLVAAAGGMCYTIYLLHYQVIAAVGGAVRDRLAPLTAGEALVVLSCAALPAVAVVSVLFYRMIERPAMEPDWPRRLWVRTWHRLAA